MCLGESMCVPHHPPIHLTLWVNPLLFKSSLIANRGTNRPNSSSLTFDSASSVVNSSPLNPFWLSESVPQLGASSTLWSPGKTRSYSSSLFLDSAISWHARLKRPPEVRSVPLILRSNLPKLNIHVKSLSWCTCNAYMTIYDDLAPISLTQCHDLHWSL